jgi:hypothetical protein
MPSAIQINVSTSSQEINWSTQIPNLPAAIPPTIQVNGINIQPSTPSVSPTGFQLVVFDITQTIPTPASILVNQYLPVTAAQYGSPGDNSWASSYAYVYSWLVNYLLLNGNPTNQLIILASYGLDANMAPDNDGLAELINNGAGSQLQYWLKHCDPGSQVGNPTSWVSYPANYIFIGFGDSGYGAGNEIYQSAGSSNSVKSSLNVTLDMGAKLVRAA